MLATIIYPTDREPLFVLVQTPQRLLVQRLKLDGLEPHHKVGQQFPVFDTTFTEQEAGQRAQGEVFSVKFSRKFQEYRYGPCPVKVGEARYYRDYSD